MSSVIAAKLDELVEDLPHLEVASFPGNGMNSMKWSLGDVKKYSNALASGLIESGFVLGDSIAIWLPKNSPEALCTKFAAARIGVKVVEIDLAVDSPETLRNIFNETSAKGVVFDPEASDRYNYKILEQAMPELTTYESEYGGWFRSRKVPSMKLLIHTAMDLVQGAQSFKYMMSFDASPSVFPALPPPETPLSVCYGPDGQAAGPALSQAATLASPAWAPVKAVLDKQHATY